MEPVVTDETESPPVVPGELPPRLPVAGGWAWRVGRALAVVGLILITAALIWVIILPAYQVGHPDPHAPPPRVGLLQW